ncbi:MAG: NAD-dependent epimerase/dehydratase family protein [Bacteroidetes bacterium]|nr:NAD-dependent epimerase/dehydratase family protein [Bacteroidota bacterium]
MKVFVSGATGFIGIQLVKRLVEEGHEVHALFRSESKANLIRHAGVKLFKGDILDKISLDHAIEGCEEAYHVAAFAGVWAKDPEMIFRLNVDGALNVIEAAGKQGVRRVVLTSTAGILGPSHKQSVHESSPAPESFFTDYEASKFQLEKQLLGRTDTDPEVIVVNPTRVYGPGYLSESNGVTKMIKQYVEGKWRLIPGNGKSSGNYVFVEDVVSGHLLAMHKGRPGERYVLGGENISYNQLFELIREASGVRHRLFKIPLWIMLAAAGVMKFISLLSGRPPLIVPDLVRKFNHNWVVSSQKATNDLGYQATNASTGIQLTVQWILNSKS